MTDRSFNKGAMSFIGIKKTHQLQLNLAIIKNNSIVKLTYPILDIEKVQDSLADEKKPLFQTLINSIVGKTYANNTTNQYHGVC